MFGRKKELRLTDHDNKRRFFLRRFWLKRVILRSLWDSFTVAVIFKQRAALAFNSLVTGWGMLSHCTVRCLISGRSRAVNSSFRFSRFSLRTATNAGFIDGLSRASW